MAARYWRINGLETYGYRVNLALAGIGLYEGGTRVDASATLTCTAPPISGALSNLQDSDTATVAVFNGDAAASPGFALTWDFGAGNDKNIDQIRVWATNDAQGFAYRLSFEYSADGAAWVATSYSGIPYPGNGGYISANFDPYLQSTVLFVKGDGANGSTTILDSSVFTRSLLAVGNANITTAVKVHGTGSIQFDGSGDKVTATSSVDFAFGSGDYALECWIRPESGSQSYARALHFGQYWLTNDSHGIVVSDPDAGGKLTYVSFRLGVARLLVSSTTLTQGVWHHIAITRASGVFRLFVNGVLESTNSSHVGASIEDSASNTLAIGSAEPSSGGEDFSGYIDDLRITKGAARYTASFTPPAEDSLGYTQTPRPMSIVSAPDTRWQYQALGNTFAALNSSPQATDLEDWGAFRITGTVKEKSTPTNTPLKRRVRLHHEPSGRMVRETWSDAITGAYAFDYIKGDQTYFVVAFDHPHNYRAVIADNMTPEPMP